MWRLVWKTFGNINPRTFLSYLCISVIFISCRELFISFRISNCRTWLWNPMVSGNLLEREGRWNEPVIRHTNFILCPLKSKHFLFSFSYNLSFSPLTCSYFTYYDSSKFTNNPDMCWKMVLTYYILNTEQEIITNTHTYTDMCVYIYIRRGTERERG